MPRYEIGDRYRWGQHRHGEWWQGTDRLRNRRLEVLPLRFKPDDDLLAALVKLLSTDFIAVQIWEAT